MTEVPYKHQKTNVQKLLAYGFEQQQDRYIFRRDLLEGQMRMSVAITVLGNVQTEVIDLATEEEYILHRIAGAAGSFVGQVRAEYDAVLEDIFAHCFDAEVFRCDQTKQIVDYARKTYGDELEFLWKRYPDNAILRRKDTQKWYAAVLTVSRRKLGFDSDDLAEIIDLRLAPEDMWATVDNKTYFPGYHMNKKHWITICLDGTLPTEEICRRIDDSYRLAIK